MIWIWVGIAVAILGGAAYIVMQAVRQMQEQDDENVNGD
jgi:uncharacterized protein YpmB